MSSEITLSTPSLLFPAISLLMLAYTNRFLSLANLIRSLHTEHHTQPNALILGQMSNLRRRVLMIRDMQTCGVLSLILCVLSMFAIFLEFLLIGKIVFAASLFFMATSLALSLMEIRISIVALNLHLSDIEKQ